LGGALAEPVKSYPTVFRPGTIFDRFPYLLPNLVCVAILACSTTIGILFLEETHEEKKHRRDIGLETGKWILSKVKRCWSIVTSRKSMGNGPRSTLNEHRPLLQHEEDQPPGYRTSETTPYGSPKFPSSRAVSPRPQEPILHSKKEVKRKTPIGRAFTKQVVLNIVGYGILA
jgi:hypothetical protein